MTLQKSGDSELYQPQATALLRLASCWAACPQSLTRRRLVWAGFDESLMKVFWPRPQCPIAATCVDQDARRRVGELADAARRKLPARGITDFAGSQSARGRLEH